MKTKLTKEINEEEFKDFLNSLIVSFDKEHLQSQIFKQLYEHTNKLSEYCENPDKFYTMVFYPIRRAIELILKTKFNKSDEASHLYLYYDFLEINVSELCSQFYGSSCSVDKGRFLVKSYIKWKDTGVMPKFNWKRKYTFHYPKSGTIEQWMNLVEGVSRLKLGYNKEYLLALKELTEEHQKYLKKQKEVRNSQP